MSSDWKHAHIEAYISPYPNYEGNPPGVLYIGDTLLPPLKSLSVESSFPDIGYGGGYDLLYTYQNPQVDMTFSIQPDAVEYNGSKSMYVIRMSEETMVKQYVAAIRKVINDNAVSLNAKSMLEALDKFEETC